MTESEAIEGLGILNNGLNEAFVNADELSEALQMAIQALEEVQKYREIGSIEECRASREKHFDVDKFLEQLETEGNKIEIQYEYNYEKGLLDGIGKAIEIAEASVNSQMQDK